MPAWTHRIGVEPSREVADAGRCAPVRNRRSPRRVQGTRIELGDHSPAESRWPITLPPSPGTCRERCARSATPAQCGRSLFVAPGSGPGSRRRPLESWACLRDQLQGLLDQRAAWDGARRLLLHRRAEHQHGADLGEELASAACASSTACLALAIFALAAPRRCQRCPGARGVIPIRASSSTAGASARVFCRGGEEAHPVDDPDIGPHRGEI